MNAIPYKKISTGGRFLQNLFMVSSLWEGPDHLLRVERDGYSEIYKRFFFRDIQSITIRRDNRRSALNIFFGAVIGLALAFFLSTTTVAVRVSWATVMAVFTVPMIWNWLAGPTCVTYFRTAVRYEEVQGLRRLRKTKKIIARIRETVGAETPLLTPEEVMARLTTESTEAPPAIVPPPLPMPPPPLP